MRFGNSINLANNTLQGRPYKQSAARLQNLEDPRVVVRNRLTKSRSIIISTFEISVGATAAPCEHRCDG